MCRSNQGAPKKMVNNTLKMKACGSCGTIAHLGKFCDSCANMVCDLCMGGMEGCCIDCEVAFPVSRFSTSLSTVDFSGALFGSDAGESSDLGLCARQQIYSDQSTEAPDSDIEADPRDCKLQTNALHGPNQHCIDQFALSRVTAETTNTVETAVTMMICNIPCRLRYEELVSAVDAAGFANMYDFIFIPRGRGSGTIGYAFIQFNNLQKAERFALSFENFQFPGRSSHKKCTVKLADKQGFNGVIQTGPNFGRAHAVGQLAY